MTTPHVTTDHRQHEQDLQGDGTFGRFGGRMMPEALMAALDELTVAWQDAMADPAFTGEFERMLREYAGTPSRSTRPRSCPRSPAPGSCSSARTSTTPVRTRSATCSARRC